MRKKGKNIRDKIIEVSVKLFEKKGYRNTTVREIAKKAGIRPGNLYYYFKSKAEILCEIHNRMISIVLENQKKMDSMQLSEKEKIEKIIKDILFVLSHYKSYLTVFLKDYNSLPPAHLKSVREVADGYRENLDKIISRGIKKGIFKNIDSTIASFGLLGMCNWGYIWFEPSGRIKPDEIVKIFSTIFLNGIENK